MKEEAGGLTPGGPGWFILNVADAAGRHHPIAGSWTRFENNEEFPFERVGFNISVIQPGKPSAKYHREDAQEGFLVLSGECIAIVEDEERPMKAWDFLHCPPNTDHVLIGAGDGPCVVIAFGSRPDLPIFYPQSDVAAKYGATAPEPTGEPDGAYSDWPEATSGKLDWPPPA